MGSSGGKPFFLFARVMALDLGMLVPPSVFAGCSGYVSLLTIRKLSTSDDLSLFNFWVLEEL